ncbi:neuroglobin-1-like [Glandiceps talaboti]
MGCSESLSATTGGKKNNGNVLLVNIQKAPKFTFEQIHDLRRTWPKLACDATGNGGQVFLQIFSINPAIKNLFPFRYVPTDILSQNEIFKMHSRRFMQAVGACVENLENLDGDVTTLFLELGKKHIKFDGFNVDYFSAYVASMQFVWDLELTGHHYSKSSRELWTVIFKFVVTRMEEGYRTAIEEQKIAEENNVSNGKTKV